MLCFLWCVPRSVSTAFEKMMFYSGEFEVVSEPFLDLYKQSLVSEQSRLECIISAERVFHELLHQSRNKPVFVKDMAYHAEPLLSDRSLKSIRHCFLIRNPKLSIPSLSRMRPEFTKDQPGFEGQLKLFKRVERLTMNPALVIDAEQLIQHPKLVVTGFFNYLKREIPSEILSWPVGSNEAWKGRESWHVRAINSKGFEKHKKNGECLTHSQKVQDSIELNMPHYLDLSQYLKY